MSDIEGRFAIICRLIRYKRQDRKRQHLHDLCVIYRASYWSIQLRDARMSRVAVPVEEIVRRARLLQAGAHGTKKLPIYVDIVEFWHVRLPPPRPGDLHWASRNRLSQLGVRRLFPRPLICSQRSDQILQFRLKHTAVAAPISKIGCQTPAQLRAVAALPVGRKHMAIKIERHDRSYSASPLFRQLLFLFKRYSYFVVYPPARQ